VGFSIRRLLWDIAALVIRAALAGAGYLLAKKLTNKGLIGLGSTSQCRWQLCCCEPVQTAP